MHNVETNRAQIPPPNLALPTLASPNLTSPNLALPNPAPPNFAQIEEFSYPESAFDTDPGFYPEWNLHPQSGPRLPASTETAPEKISGDGDAESFRYLAVPGSVQMEEEESYGLVQELKADGGYAGFSSHTDRSRDQEHLQQLLAQETRKAEERGRILGFDQGMLRGREMGLEQGIQQGRELGRSGVIEEGARHLEEERGRLHIQAASLVESFARAKEHYFHQLEDEAVQLALAIAARILRREAQADPLLLTGSVRVALGQLATSTRVRLEVPVADQPLWQEAMARMPGLPLRPQVVGDSQMELGECRLETELGSADLGLWAQLKTIEKNFFERPGAHEPSEVESARPTAPASGKASPQAERPNEERSGAT